MHVELQFYRGIQVSCDGAIISMLRNRLTAKDTHIADLRVQLRERDHIIAVLQGELERRDSHT